MDPAIDIGASVANMPPDCQPYVNALVQYAMSKAVKFAVAELMNFIDPEKREAVAYAVADSAVDVAALVGEIFTASATKEVFGWGRNFNVNKRIREMEPFKTLLRATEMRLSPLGRKDGPEVDKYHTWPTYSGPWSQTVSSAPIVALNLSFVKDLVQRCSEGVKRGDATYPDGQFSAEDWSELIDSAQFNRLVFTSEPIHIGYKFPIGSIQAVHHGLYFGQASGADGGLVIEVMNRVYRDPTTGTESVRSFIAPSTLLNFLRRTAVNGLDGLLVYEYASMIPMSVALERAVWATGHFTYNVMKHNCENFVSWVLMNRDSNSICTTFQSTVCQQVRQQLGLQGGRRRKPRARPQSKRSLREFRYRY